MSKKARRSGLTVLALSALLWTSGCVIQNTPEKIAQVEETNDPFEPTNRYIFEINRFLDEMFLKPVAAMYNAALPQAAQNGVTRFLANLRQPWTAINDLLQGQPNRSGQALSRFVINSTVGVAGVFDVATGWGFPGHEEDLGQTLAAWGLPEGPYIMLPVFGPSNPRDTVGLAGDFYLDPVNWIARTHDDTEWAPTARGVVTAVDNRNRNDQVISDLQKQSTDFYATVRSIYRQRRDAQIKNRGEDGGNTPPRISLAPDVVSPQVPSGK